HRSHRQGPRRLLYGRSSGVALQGTECRAIEAGARGGRSLRTTFISTLTELAERNPDIWLLCGDLGFSVLEQFATRIPERYVNVGVAEQNMAGIAAGLALSGKTVFIYSIGNFPTFRCLEQLRNDVGYHDADVKVVSVGGGFAYGSQGYTHHA